MIEIETDDILRIIKGISSGIYYGGKVRLMHSLVMSVLFMSGASNKEKLISIFKLTADHSIRLGVFVGVYKTVVMLLNKLERRKSKLHCFIAGCVGALVINLDGESAVNQQITMYIIARVIYGGGKSLQKKNVAPKFNLFVWSYALVTGFLFLIYAIDKKSFPYSMTKSMDFLYIKGDKYAAWTDYVPFYVPDVLKSFVERLFQERLAVTRSS